MKDDAPISPESSEPRGGGQTEMRTEVGACPQCGTRLSQGAGLRLCGVCALQDALASPAPASSPGGTGGEQGDTTRSGRRLGDYELLEEIARGGMGVVWRARQLSLNRMVAVKMIRAGRFASREEVLRFRAEAEAAAHLRHPNIVSVHETGEYEGQPYFSMDYVEGSDLAGLVREHPLPARRAAAYVKTIAEAIHHAHEQGILHRDLKPSNILVTENGEIRITDFGLAKRVQNESFLTVTGQVLGSPNFMPPEQCGYRAEAPSDEERSAQGSPRERRSSGGAGPIKAGRYSDVYSLGAILFYLLTGRPPFMGETMVATLQQVLTMEPVAPSLLNPAVPTDLSVICGKCLEKEPRKRFSTAQAVAEELGRFLNDEPIQARPAGLLEKGWRWCRRNPLVAGWMAACVVLLAAVALVSTLAAWRIQGSATVLAENLYAADMKLVGHYYEEGHLGRARELLAAYDNPVGRAVRGFEWGCFRRLTSGSQSARLLAHTNGVSDAAFSPGGAGFVTVSFDNTLRFWDYPSLRPKAGFELDLVSPSSLSFSRDGQKVATATAEHGVYVWDVASGRLVSRLAGRWVRAEFSPAAETLLVCEGNAHHGGWPGRVAVWDIASAEVREAPRKGDRVAWSQDGRAMWISSGDGVIWMIETESNRVLNQFETPGPVFTLACSPDGRYLAASSQTLPPQSEPSLHLWDLQVGANARECKGHGALVWQVSFSPDSRLVASASSDQTVRVWETASRRCREVFRGHGNEVWTVDFAPDGRELASGDKDGVVLRWKLAGPVPGESDTQFGSLLGPVVFSPHGDAFGVGIGGRRVGVFDAATAKLQHVVEGADFALGFSADGSEFTTFTDTEVSRHAWPGLRLVERKPLQQPLNNDFPCLAVSEDQRWLAAAQEPGRIDLWDMRTGQKAAPIEVGKPAHVHTLAFSPESDRLVMLGWDDATIQVFSREGRPRTVLRGHKLDVWSIAFCRDGRRLASASMDDTACIWDLETGSLLRTLAGHREGVSCVAWSPDGQTLAVVSGPRGRIKLWNMATYREVGDLDAGGAAVNVTFSPDGRSLLAWRPWAPGIFLRSWGAEE